MQQLIFILISFLYGFLIAIIHSCLFKKQNIWELLYFLVATLIYVYIFYLLNSGEIHIYNKFSLIGGYIVYYIIKKCKLMRKY